MGSPPSWLTRPWLSPVTIRSYLTGRSNNIATLSSRSTATVCFLPTPMANTLCVQSAERVLPRTNRRASARSTVSICMATIRDWLESLYSLGFCRGPDRSGSVLKARQAAHKNIPLYDPAVGGHSGLYLGIDNRRFHRYVVPRTAVAAAGWSGGRRHVTGNGEPLCWAEISAGKNCAAYRGTVWSRTVDRLDAGWHPAAQCGFGQIRFLPPRPAVNV